MSERRIYRDIRTDEHFEKMLVDSESPYERFELLMLAC